MMTRRVPTLLVAAIQLGVVASVAAQAQPDRIAMARRVSVRSLGGDSTAIISLVVADLEGKPGQAEVWSVLIGSGTKFTDLRTLAAWAAAVRASRR